MTIQGFLFHKHSSLYPPIGDIAIISFNVILSLLLLKEAWIVIMFMIAPMISFANFSSDLKQYLALHNSESATESKT